MYRVYDWKLLYSMTQHGISMHQLYRSAKNLGPYLLILKDGNKNVFGAFISETIHEDANYYGSGETFMFKFDVVSKVFHWLTDNLYLG